MQDAVLDTGGTKMKWEDFYLLGGCGDLGSSRDSGALFVYGGMGNSSVCLGAWELEEDPASLLTPLG